MKVSIIVPVYKTECYLRQCIDSILAQTYTDLEIILVDDGSPDNSGEICDEYAAKDSRVRVIHKENGGLSDARNLGIHIASGDYLMFVDSDDYIAPEMTAELMKALIDNDVGMSLCSLAIVDENGVEIPDEIGQSPIKREVLSREQAITKLMEPFYWYYVVAVAKLYRRELFDGIRYPKGKIHEDEFAAHHLLGKCERIACIPDEFYKYVQRSGSITHNRNSHSQLNAAEAFLDRAIYLEKLGCHGFVGKLYMRAIWGISKYYKAENNEIVTQESEELLKALRENADLQKYCTSRERVRAKLICISPRLYQFLQRTKQQIKGMIRK